MAILIHGAIPLASSLFRTSGVGGAGLTPHKCMKKTLGGGICGYV